MSKTNQPVWKFLANVGDIDPYISAELVYIDLTGVYAPKMICFNESFYNQDGTFHVFNVSLERCTMLNNCPETLSDNRYHADKPTWFAQKIAEVAKYVGMETFDFASLLVSEDPIDRARAYSSLISYFGFHEFDSSPSFMNKTQIRKHYPAAFRKPKSVNSRKIKETLLAP